MSKVVVISQPRYLPALNYLARMAMADIFVLLDTVQYTPRDWENRNKIVLNNKSPSWLTVPVIHQAQDQKISDIYIDNSQQWARKHLNALRHAYGKHRYFTQYFDFFSETYQQPWTKLIALNFYLIQYFAKVYKLNCQFFLASDLAARGAGEQLLINICHELKADIYLSGPLGRDYINVSRWNKADLQIRYHDYQHPTYYQPYPTFIPWLNGCDLLFNEGPNSAKIIKESL